MVSGGLGKIKLLKRYWPRTWRAYLFTLLYIRAFLLFFFAPRHRDTCTRLDWLKSNNFRLWLLSILTSSSVLCLMLLTLSLSVKIFFLVLFYFFLFRLIIATSICLINQVICFEWWRTVQWNFKCRTYISDIAFQLLILTDSVWNFKHTNYSVF